MFSSKTLIYFRLKKDMDILDDMGVSKLSAKVFFILNWFLWENEISDGLIFNLPCMT